ncbi:MAG: type II toxin-antitoxin system HicA family toxin [Chloroflexi bacterium]|nr:type II toxin-antitoxin system HicA family toxin [Chloroflexota bacterium]MBM3155064.1 type II toxin-antitoxin system HicA family toxin [Chloroflexota bacterium]MBM3173417.1 type II toxin-antitoxin system HicA family toxin [Chloroflexota bacterium]MBM3174238.1 type II toxin-antitoxin system HicA family toxin [Chloroflexota bacterium]MBM4451015.1 type II toxin-antitoxin system HicA family toxin [Chloroflexota bacterium]
MPQKLPSLKPAEMINALDKAGFKIVRQTGSHVIMWKPGLKRPIPVPIHQKELKRTLQTRIIKQAGLTPEQFKAFL